MIHRALAATRGALVAPWNPPGGDAASSADVYEGAPALRSPAIPPSLAPCPTGPGQARISPADSARLCAVRRATCPQALQRALAEVAARSPQHLARAVGAVETRELALACVGPHDLACCLAALDLGSALQAETRRALGALQRSLAPPLALELLTLRVQAWKAAGMGPSLSDLVAALDGAAWLTHPEVAALGERLLALIEPLGAPPLAGLRQAFGQEGLDQLAAGCPLDVALRLGLVERRAAPSLRDYLEGPEGPDAPMLQRLGRTLHWHTPALAWLERQLSVLPEADARLWRGLTVWGDLGTTPNVWRLLHLVMAHPQAEQSAALLRGLKGALRDEGPRVLEPHAQAQRALGPGKAATQTLLLKLQLTVCLRRPHPPLSRALKLPGTALATHPRWLRLASCPQLVRDALKVRRALAGMQAIDDPSLLQAILTYPPPDRLEATLPAPLREQTAKRRASGEDLLTAGVRKQEVNTYYGQRVLPDILDYLQLAETLGAPSNARVMLDESGALLPAEAVRAKVQAMLVGSHPAPQFAAMLARWRELGGLLRYLRNLEAIPECVRAGYADLLREALRHEAAGDAPGWRLQQSAQMRKICEATPSFAADAWRAGAQTPAQELCETLPQEWTVHDTGDLNDLLNMASEGASSCQSLDSSWRTNVGLLGRLFDGSQRLIAFKDATGKIRARVGLVLVHNGRGQPGLLLTGFYRSPTASVADLKVAIRAFARARAAALQLPLLEGVRRYGAPARFGAQGPGSVWHMEANSAPDYWDEAPGYGVRRAGQTRTFNLVELRPTD